MDYLALEESKVYLDDIKEQANIQAGHLQRNRASAREC